MDEVYLQELKSNTLCFRAKHVQDVEDMVMEGETVTILPTSKKGIVSVTFHFRRAYEKYVRNMVLPNCGHVAEKIDIVPTTDDANWQVIYFSVYGNRRRNPHSKKYIKYYNLTFELGGIRVSFEELVAKLNEISKTQYGFKAFIFGETNNAIVTCKNRRVYDALVSNMETAEWLWEAFVPYPSNLKGERARSIELVIGEENRRKPRRSKELVDSGESVDTE